MKKENKKYNITTLTLIGLTIVCGGVLASSIVSADDYYVDNFSINVPVSCSILSTIDTAHAAEVPNGTYEDDIGQTTIKAYCNDTNGFSIYAIGYTGEEYGNNTLVGTNNSSSTIATGTAVSGDTSNWAMKLEAVSGTYTPTITNSFNNYHTVPDTYTKVATYASATDIGEAMNSANGSSIHTTYAVYVSYTQPADTYAGKVKYTLVHPNDADAPTQPQTATSGCINYFPNGSNVVGTMGCQEISSSDTEATLLAGNFSRSGYGFAGWSDAFDYATNANVHFYGPNEDITFTAGQYTGSNPGLSLYAVWIKSQGNFQDASKTTSVCNELTAASTSGTRTLASVSALTDTRDNETYAIAKLADGKCWMVENLRLENNAQHNSDGTLAQGYNSSFAGLAIAESTRFTNSTATNSLYSTDGSTDKTISGSYQGYRFPRYNNTNTSARASSPTANTVSMYSYGNYYTWHAAIADTTHYSSGDHGTTSLCPKGWQIPLGNTSTGDISQGSSDTANRVGSFSYLDRKMGGTGAYQATMVDSLRWRKFPVNFIYSGYFATSSTYTRGSSCSYWSSTANDGTYSYNLYLYSSYVSPGIYGSSKSNGYSIRCIASIGP